MSLPLVYPIKGFTKADEFLLNTRESLRTSSFHVYVGERGPEVLKIRRLFSLCDSTYRNMGFYDFHLIGISMGLRQECSAQPVVWLFWIVQHLKRL